MYAIRSYYVSRHVSAYFNILEKYTGSFYENCCILEKGKYDKISHLLIRLKNHYLLTDSIILRV